MAHIHGVYDCDTHFKIDGTTRTVKNMSEVKTQLVQYDHNSERFTFEIPRMIDGHDMSLCDVVEVHFLNVDTSTRKQMPGVYKVDDLQISKEDENIVVGSWLISRSATQYVGELSFSICFACTADDGSIDYAWRTAVYGGLKVIETLYNAEVATGNGSGGGGGSVALDVTLTKSGMAADAAAVGEKVGQLADETAQNAETISQLSEEKADKAYGAGNANKLLITDEDGNAATAIIGEGLELAYVAGKNLIHGDWVRGKWNSTTNGSWVAGSNYINIGIKEKFPVVGGEAYTMSYAGNLAEKESIIYMYEYDAEDNMLKMWYAITCNKENSKTITLNAATVCVGVCVLNPKNPETLEAAIPQNLMLEKGSAVTSYEPYGATGQISVPKGQAEPDKFAVPDYYHENDYLDNKCARIRELLDGCAGNGDAFFFVTDQHWPLNAKQSPALIRYIASKVRIPRLFSGGDTADYVSEEYASLLSEAYAGKIHHAVGNHDYFSPMNGNKIAYIFDMGKTEQVGSAERHYYYVDNPQQKVRYVVLSVYDNQDGALVSGIEAEQATWATEIAFDVDDDWTVIVLGHALYYTTNPPPTGYFGWPEGMADIVRALEAATFDTACLIGGHMHKDGICHTPEGIPSVTVTCDKCDPWASGGVDQEPWLSTRVRGTITEQAFDVVVLDKAQRKLTFVRIGAPADNMVDGTSTGAVEERVVTY
jgi:hypothetical protein